MSFIRLLALVSFAGSLSGPVHSQTLPEGDVPTVDAVPEIAALVPAEISERGTLRVAAMTKYQPYSFTVGNRQVGMIPEMITAVTQAMGLKVELSPIEFPAILLGLESQRYDIGMGEYFVREDRLAVADFLTEWSNYNAFIINADDEYRPEGLADVCGHSIAILAGSSGVPAMEIGAERCAANAEPAPSVMTFPNMSDAVLALASRRVEAVLTGREVGVTLVQSGQPFETIGRVGGGPTATAVARNDNSDQLLEALKAAYLHLIETGVYETIHTRWGTEYGMIDNPTIYRAGDQPPSYDN